LCVRHRSHCNGRWSNGRWSNRRWNTDRGRRWSTYRSRRRGTYRSSDGCALRHNRRNNSRGRRRRRLCHRGNGWLPILLRIVIRVVIVCGIVVLAGVGIAIPPSPGTTFVIQLSANRQRQIVFNRTGMRLLVQNPQVRQQIQNRFWLYFQFPGQFIDTDHRMTVVDSLSTRIARNKFPSFLVQNDTSYSRRQTAKLPAGPSRPGPWTTTFLS
jgi:hypothetical protein